MIYVSLTYVFLICTVVPLLFGLWAQFKVKSTFKRYSQVPVASGMTGAPIKYASATPANAA